MAERTQRRLAAIVSMDVVGYSRMMGIDEVGTLAALRLQRSELIDPTIDEFGGRVVKTMGDGLLLEFPSVVDAVQCSITVQESMAESNANVPEDKQIVLRIGINLGDIIIEGDDIHGDGVNVAARLEPLSEPGGICISSRVHDDVQDKLDANFIDSGRQELKNIARPVQVWHWGKANDVKVVSSQEQSLALPEKPSMVVLPFDNMSADVEQDYFADGLTEDIITELSRFQTFFIIARHSAFVYKGKAVTVQDVGRELGVQYVVEGSVRKAGNRMRVTVQLIEAASGNHIWAERYDHNLADLFDLQDEIMRSIVSAIPGRLADADLDRIKRKHPENMVAYDYTLRGKMHHHRYTKEDNIEAIRLLDKAIELDPNFSEAHAWKSCSYAQAAVQGFDDDKEKLWLLEVEEAEKAISLGENNANCQWVMCEMLMARCKLEQAEFHHQKAFALNPNDPRIVAQRGEILTWQGHPVEGAEWVRQAMRLDPYDASRRAHLLGRALYVAGLYEDAIKTFKQVRMLRYNHHAEIAACYAQLGSDKNASEHAKEVLQLKPDFSIADHMQDLLFREIRDCDIYRDGLNKAGLPE